MARIFMDGFEYGVDYSLWNNRESAYISSSSIPAGFSGTYFLNCSGDFAIEKTFATTYSELYFAFKYYKPVTYALEQVLSIKDSDGTIIFSLTRNYTSGFFQIHIGTW